MNIQPNLMLPPIVLQSVNNTLTLLKNPLRHVSITHQLNPITYLLCFSSKKIKTYGQVIRRCRSPFSHLPHSLTKLSKK